MKNILVKLVFLTALYISSAATNNARAGFIGNIFSPKEVLLQGTVIEVNQIFGLTFVAVSDSITGEIRYSSLSWMKLKKGDTVNYAKTSDELIIVKTILNTPKV